MAVGIAAASIAVAGLAMKGVSTYQQNRQAEYTSRLNVISNDINKYTMFENAALQQQDMISQYARDESTATTVAAAQNRRGGSVDAVQKEKKRMLDRNITQLQKSADISGAMYDLDSASGTKAGEAANQARNTQLAGDALSLVSTLV